MKLSIIQLSTLFSALLLASPVAVSALQQSHHVQQGRHARAHDGVLARRAVKQEMQARGEQDWVQERQLIPIGGDDETEDETTSVSAPDPLLVLSRTSVRT